MSHSPLRQYFPADKQGKHPGQPYLKSQQLHLSELVHRSTKSPATFPEVLGFSLESCCEISEQTQSEEVLTWRSLEYCPVLMSLISIPQIKSVLQRLSSSYSCSECVMFSFSLPSTLTEASLCKYPVSLVGDQTHFHK